MSLNQSWNFYHQQQQQLQHQHQHHPTQPQRQPAFYEPSRLASPFESDLSAPDLDFDFDTHFHHQHHSLSSSPISTQSVPSQYSASPLSTFDSIPTAHEGSLFESSSQSSQPPPDSAAPFLTNTGPMQTESWLPNGQLTPRSVGRFAHERDSSRSSMGSNGPASPYSHNISHPQIAVNDPAGDSFHSLGGADELNYQLAAKSFPGATHDNFYTTLPATYGSNNGSGMAPYPYAAAVPKQRRNDGGLLAPSERPIGSARSQAAVSVASSIASDSPVTPAGEPEEDRRRNTAMHTVPKLARTMTDAYSDELYSPDFTIASSTSGQAPMSPTNDLFAQRLQAANTQHLSAVSSHSPVSATSRDRSPFRQGSPLAPMPMHDFRSAMGPSQMRFPSAQQMREQNKAMQDAQAVQQHITRAANTSTPQTISPKDAMLEFHEPEGDANFPLFPQHNANGFNADTMSKTAAAPQAHPAFDAGAFNNYLTSASMQIPQQYPFIAQPRQQSAVPSASNKESVPTSRRGSADTAATESAYATPRRPADTTADGGTYTCTYHGCTMRFETPALLQKHKREGHRAAHGLNATRRPESMGMTATLLNTQAGPHRCDRINPSTMKPCNTVFSRPYDLTRHEDTIHNVRKQKVRCDMCTDEKTFSRADALTRHYRVCHPDVEFPGKHRRRGGHSV
ncbi:hypothetical protein BT67DRAFT_205113 [Trichocladium antarcticum]|uniref:C2H2-type domain-containing protein n=1 Tax=Trichocladium antarcticum TaxID=1450529 RepID=A0AAN6UD94_9PEZI|nr:hypothetical protein BT67DRAFT_205113 [Trichocladium antarcticum]